MKRNTKITFIFAALALALILAATTLAVSARSELERIKSASPAPSIMSYQGYLADDTGTPINGTVDLQFGLYDGEFSSTLIWTETHTSVPVSEGYFALMLGSIYPLGADDFDGTTRYLQVDVDTGGGYTTLPRQQLASVPYAFVAENADVVPWSGLTGVPSGFADGLDDVELENVILVAKNGGHFDSIQAAVDSIAGASSDNRYLIWIGPGTYEEQVILKDFVYLEGAGEGLTLITSTISNTETHPPVDATLHLSGFSDVRNLTVLNEGVGSQNVAILRLDGTGPTNLVNVSAMVNGLGEKSYGIFLGGDSTDTTLENVSAYAMGASFINASLDIAQGASATLQDGRFEGYGGEWSLGILVSNESSSLHAYEVSALGSDGSHSIGLDVIQNAAAVVHGGDFTARNGLTVTWGIAVWDGSFLNAYGVNAIGEDAVYWNHGLTNDDGTANLYGGTFTARGGIENYGIININGGILEAVGIMAVGEGATDRNDGFRNESGALAVLSSSVFKGIGGLDARGVANYGEDSIIDLNQCTVSGVSDSTEDTSIGLSNEDSGLTFITNSELWGETASLFNDGTAAEIHLSKLLGGTISGSGSTTCLAVTYSGAFYADACPVP